jgi:hypothetical protein
MKIKEKQPETVDKVVKLKKDYMFIEGGRIRKAGTDLQVSPELYDELKTKEII